MKTSTLSKHSRRESPSLPAIASQDDKRLKKLEHSIMNQEIVYRNRSLKRKQLVDMRNTLNDKCEQIISVMNWPFKTNNLTTEKIFNDLV